MKMEVIELSKFEKRKSKWGGGSQPLTMYFCYPKSGPVLVKGMSEEVKEYVKHKTGPCHYRYVFFGDGITRGNWCSNVEGVFISLSKHRNGHQRYKLSIFKNHEFVKEIWMRRIPLKYLKEFDELNIRDTEGLEVA